MSEPSMAARKAAAQRIACPRCRRLSHPAERILDRRGRRRCLRCVENQRVLRTGPTKAEN